MDIKAKKQIGDLVESVTTTGERILQDELVDAIKLVASKTDDGAQLIFDMIFQQLKAKNSQIRLLAVLLSGELFSPNRAFRLALCKEFRAFIELSVGPRLECELPGPAEFASLTRKSALSLIEDWNKRFSSAHKSIALGYRYLKDTLKMQFPNTQNARQQQQQQLQQQLEAQRRSNNSAAQQQLISLIETEMEEFVPQARSLIAQVESCLLMLKSNENIVSREKKEEQKQEAREEDDSWEQVDFNDPSSVLPSGAIEDQEWVVGEEDMDDLYEKQMRMGRGGLDDIRQVERLIVQELNLPHYTGFNSRSSIGQKDKEEGQGETSPSMDNARDSILDAMDDSVLEMRTRIIPKISEWMAKLSSQQTPASASSSSSSSSSGLTPPMIILDAKTKEDKKALLNRVTALKTETETTMTNANIMLALRPPRQSKKSSSSSSSAAEVASSDSASPKDNTQLLSQSEMQIVMKASSVLRGEKREQAIMEAAQEIILKRRKEENASKRKKKSTSSSSEAPSPIEEILGQGTEDAKKKKKVRKNREPTPEETVGDRLSRAMAVRRRHEQAASAEAERRDDVMRRNLYTNRF